MKLCQEVVLLYNILLLIKKLIANLEAQTKTLKIRYCIYSYNNDCEYLTNRLEIFTVGEPEQRKYFIIEFFKI